MGSIGFCVCLCVCVCVGGDTLQFLRRRSLSHRAGQPARGSKNCDHGSLVYDWTQSSAAGAGDNFFDVGSIA